MDDDEDDDDDDNSGVCNETMVSIQSETVEIQNAETWALNLYRKRSRIPVSYTHLDVYKRQLLSKLQVLKFQLKCFKRC